MGQIGREAQCKVSTHAATSAAQARARPMLSWPTHARRPCEAALLAPLTMVTGHVGQTRRRRLVLWESTMGRQKILNKNTRAQQSRA